MAVTKEELPTKALRELSDKLKRGYTLERTSGNHFRVRNPQGQLVQWKNKNLRVASSVRNMDTVEADFKGAGVLQAERKPQRVSPAERERSRAGIDAMRATNRQQTIERRDRARELRDRMRPWWKAIGADTPGVTWDISRYLSKTTNGVFPTAESAVHAIRNVMEGAGIKDESREAIDQLSKRFEAEPEPLVLYVEIAREARGIDVDELQMPAGKEWPFNMKLVEAEACFTDERYQRPSPERFIREIVLHFDERKVGAIQVSARDNDTFAILDGQTRWRSCQIIGKKRIWAAIYEGMDLAAEANFFYEVNKHRKTVQPYYGFRARVLAGEPKAVAINTIVTKAELKVHPNTDALNGGIAAVASLEAAFDLQSEVREDTLTPGLRILGQTWKGLKRSTDSELIRGLGRFYAAYSDEEIDDERFTELLGGYGPQLVINRARDLVFQTGGSTTGAKASGLAMAKALVDIHNTGLPRARRLDAKRLERF